MAEKQTRTARHAQGDGSPKGQHGRKPLNVMDHHGHTGTPAHGNCTDLRHPNMPYWHPLNGPFPSD